MDDPRINKLFKEFDALGLTRVRIGISTGEFKLTPLKEPAAREWVRLKEIQESKLNNIPILHWYQKPVGLIGITLISGLLVFLATFLIGKYLDIHP